jgi:SAM-dependent methyltransferase
MKKSQLQKFRAREAKKLLKDLETLDMGGADGWLISQAINPEKVTVIDLDKKALEKNPSKNKIYGDLTKNKIKGDSFLQVILFEVIEHVPKKEDRIKIFNQAHRILQEGGKLIISTPNYERFSTQLRKIISKKRKYPYPVAGGKGIPYTDWHYFEYSQKSIKKDLEEGGFKKIETYGKFIQIPFFQNFFNIKSKYGLVLYAIAEK